ncbi:MAG: hypothetical protein IJX63_08040 [Lachnospiraceae bacterium]|nr:hypothetical protein [Lachnospiraceae bacterium]
MNCLRIILDGVILCIAFNGVAAFVWLLEPIGFSVMLPKGINTPLKDIPKKNIMPIRVMELTIYPIFIAYMVLSAYEAGITGFGNLFWAAFIENLFWNFGDFFFLDWWLREKYTERIMVPGTEDNELWKTGPWMKRFGIVDHWGKWPIICVFLSLIIAGIGMLIR